MNTGEHIKKNDGRMLVFDLAEKLKVVGTYHALNQKDKEELGQLVEASDFIASEGCGEEVIEPIAIPFTKRLRYDPVIREYISSFLDSLYMDWIKRQINFRLKINTAIVAQSTGVDRDWKPNEFEYCMELAKEKNKEFYGIDLCRCDFYSFLLNQSTKEKIKHLLGMGSGSFWEKLEELSKIRERSMLENIIKREGPISQLKRQGLMPVGYTHALNYLSGKHSDLLQ